ncbi:energy-coupling factor transport system ATP-binding protein [Evansella caseinilytica]|uniref:Energy-coupling factor transport system ATP-binding protein n=1 Tax=Evansella caseinilytica TaxID=1503961 RepID=A0A1H3UK60_9BACI|nr:energy-coupling factor transporter ATPase [Evansella caseinilytica]SDZ62774.1 energy-coupling factor transport system ATP-binding protein [Evansella caseinilytica]
MTLYKKEVIRVENLSFQYTASEADVLKNINLSIHEGEWTAIAGHNGSGKSTLAKFFNALFIPAPDRGQVYIHGTSTSEKKYWSSIRKKVAMVFQNPDNQIVAPTVEDDVAFGLENAGVPHEEMVRLVKESIDIMGLSGLERQEPHHLSGGQKQRVGLAGALALRPDILVLDEAASMLDPQGRKEVLDCVARLREHYNMTIITITHDLNEALRANRMIVMKEGVVIGDDTPRNIFKNKTLLDQAGLKQPFLFQMINALNEQGILVDGDMMTEEELVGALCKLKQTT